MSNRWLAALAVLVACGPSRHEEPAPEPAPVLASRRYEEPDPWLAPRQRDPAPQPPQPDPPPMQPQQDPPPRPPQQPQPRPLKACLDSGSITSFEAGAVLRACFDQDGDNMTDRCVRWRPDGKPFDYDPAVDNVPNPPLADPIPEPVTFHSDSQNNDDGRIELDGSTIQICAYERACMKLMPHVGDDFTMTDVLTDPEYHRAAITMPGYGGPPGHVELWDLDRGRRYARLPFRGLMRDIDYTLSVKLGRGALIALASSNVEHSVSGAIYGLDGGFRGMLAGGTRALDLEGAIETDGQFVILEEQPDKQPHLLHAVDLATGATSRFAIARADEAATEIELRKLTPGVVTAVQWGQRLRLDVIDLRKRAQRTLYVKGC